MRRDTRPATARELARVPGCEARRHTYVHPAKACVWGADHRAIRTGKLAALHIASESRADGVRSPLNRLARAATQACAPEDLVAALEDAFSELLGTTEFHVVAVTQDNTGAHGDSVALRT